MRIFTLIVLVVLGILQCRHAVADSNSYCGIYAAYGAAAVLKSVHIPFKTLIDEEYISKRNGSTVSDLEEAAKTLGVNSRSMQGLGIASLENANDPLILHVASTGQLIEYDHWMLFLGIEKGMARVIDSNEGIRLISIPKLLARWDGVAIAFFEGEHSISDYASLESSFMLNNALFAGIAVIIASIVLCLVFKSKKATRSVSLGSFLLSCVLFIVFAELFSASGVSRDSSARLFVHAAIKEGDFPLLDIGELKSIVQNPKDCIVIDARRTSSFNFGSIPGARSIPIDIKDEELRQRISDLRKDQPIVIFCQSKGCAYDERIGVRLAGRGFSNIRLFRGGWVEWIAANSK